MVQWRLLQSLEETAVLHFDSMMGAFGGHANHGDASRYALHAVLLQIQSLDHVQVSRASPIRHLQDVTSDDQNWSHLQSPLGSSGLLVAVAAHYCCVDLCLHNTACAHVRANMLCLFYLRILIHMQESLAHVFTCCMSGTVLPLFESQVPAAYRSVHKPVVLC